MGSGLSVTVPGWGTECLSKRWRSGGRRGLCSGVLPCSRLSQDCNKRFGGFPCEGEEAGNILVGGWWSQRGCSTWMVAGRWRSQREGVWQSMRKDRNLRTAEKPLHFIPILSIHSLHFCFSSGLMMDVTVFSQHISSYSLSEPMRDFLFYYFFLSVDKYGKVGGRIFNWSAGMTSLKVTFLLWLLLIFLNLKWEAFY